MENALADIEDVAVFIDDIIVTASDDEGHLERLRLLFERLLNCGLRLKREKCEFFKIEVYYLGYKIDKNGLHTTPNRIKAINNAKIPQNLTELRAFLGMVNFYHKFIPDAATILHPLYQLLKRIKNIFGVRLVMYHLIKLKKLLHLQKY